jgi:steroid delta-isomerase-like uncharacterized protein
MSNKAVSIAFFTTYAGQRDVEGCSPLFAGDAVISTSVAPSPLDFAAYKQVGYAFLGGFADLKAEVHEQIEAGNKVVSRVVWSGTHTGALNGIPATGRTFSSEAIFIDTFENGQIVERREVSDMLGMLQQLGVIPASQAA